MLTIRRPGPGQVQQASENIHLLPSFCSRLFQKMTECHCSPVSWSGGAVRSLFMLRLHSCFIEPDQDPCNAHLIMFNFVGFEQLVGLKSGIWDLSSFCVWLLFLFKEVESKCVVTEVLYLPVRTELRFWHFPFPLLGFWGNYWTNPLCSSDGGSVIKSALQIQSQILFFLPSSHFHFFISFWSSTHFFLPSGLFIHQSCIHSSSPSISPLPWFISFCLCFLSIILTSSFPHLFPFCLS